MTLNIILVDAACEARRELEPALAERGYGLVWTCCRTLGPILQRVRVDIAIARGPAGRDTLLDNAPSLPMVDMDLGPRRVCAAVEQLFPPPTTLTGQDVTLSLPQRTVHRAGVPPSTLTVMECRLLRFLAEQEERYVPESEIRNKVWHYHASAKTSAVRNSIYRLRKKLEADPRTPLVLEGVPGLGYRLNLARAMPNAGDELARITKSLYVRRRGPPTRMTT